MSSNPIPNHTGPVAAPAPATRPAAAPKPKTYLKPAVHQNKLLSRKGLSEGLFTLWFGGFVYNQIWEDPRVDIEGLELNADSRIMQIASGGCNVLNYLTAQPARIVAVDLNRHHIFLTRLKIAALTHLPDHEHFFRFFGCGDDKANLEAYHRYIKKHLDRDTRRYWEQRLRWWPLGGPRINYFTRNFYNASKLGLILRVSHLAARSLKINPAEMLEAQSLDEQRAWYEANIEPMFDNRAIRALSRVPLVGFSLGIPPAQHAEMMSEAGGHIADVYKERIRKIMCDFPARDNYFAWQGFARKYDRVNREGIPDYLREENYELLRGQVHKLETHVTSMNGWMAAQPEKSMDRFVFLDAQDWMPPATLDELWTEVLRIARPGTRIVFRTAGSISPLETKLAKPLRDRLVYEEERSRELFKRDRSAIYGGFHVYHTKD